MLVIQVWLQIILILLVDIIKNPVSQIDLVAQMIVQHILKILLFCIW